METNLTPAIEKTKLKISTTSTVKVEKEISLPYYANHKGYQYYAVLSENKAILVNAWGEYGGDGILVKGSVIHLLDDAIEITKEEFEAAFQNALSKIQNLSL